MITLSDNQAAEIRLLLREYHSTLDNLLYHYFSNDRLAVKLSHIDDMLSAMESQNEQWIFEQLKG